MKILFVSKVQYIPSYNAFGSCYAISIFILITFCDTVKVLSTLKHHSRSAQALLVAWLGLEGRIVLGNEFLLWYFI